MRFQLTLAARYLTGRKLRTFLTTLAIVIGVMVIFGTGIYLPSFTDAFNKSLLSASGQTDVMITHKTGESFAASTLNKLKRVQGIAVMAGSLERVVNLPPDFYGKDSTVNALTLVGLEALRPSPSQVMQRFSRISVIAGAVMIVAAVGGLLTGAFVFVALGGVPWARRLAFWPVCTSVMYSFRG
ncbi:MAG: hypothetical protein Fur0044_01140 [Anaerolineae bacterium]